MAYLRRLPLVIAAIGFGCGSRALDPGNKDGTGGISVATGDGGAIGDGGGGDPVKDGGWPPIDAAIETLPPERCGDGFLDPKEACDDGNHVGGDGCSPLCQIECYRLCGTCGTRTFCINFIGCGNGVLDPDEACDDGNVTGGDGCAADCRTVEIGWSCSAPGRQCTPVCGDTRVVGAETCDDGNTIAGDGCSDICLVEPTTARCGDGIVEGDEECDQGTGNTTYRTGCTAACRFTAYCGDGVVNGPEECDLGPGQNNTIHGIPDNCTPSCTRPHYCGDGIVDANDGEQCDFGANNGLPSGDCSVECKIYIR